MDKEIILKKIEAISEEFRKLKQQKLELQQEIIKCEQEMLHLDGQYTAYATVLKELNIEQEMPQEEIPQEE